MKKWIAVLLAVILCLGIAGCSPAPTETEEVHQIGVIVYDTGNEEVIGMREYLQGYIEKNFEMVKFVYSDTIRTPEQEQAFIQGACDAGVEGFLSFFTTDLKAEVELCEKNNAYYLLASGTVPEEEFAEVADNPWFLGMFGPGNDLEYQAGADLGRCFAEMSKGSRFLVLSGGASLGNEMHFLRTKGILDALFAGHGYVPNDPTEEFAAVSEPTTVTMGALKITVVPGYYDFDEVAMGAAREALAQGYSTVLCVMPPMEIANSLNGAQLGIIDSYNGRNFQLFADGKLNFVEGKYSSIIGPAFALMLNAVTGYAQDFRDGGRAVTAEQGFWWSDSLEDFTNKYALSNSESMNAYSFEDLAAVCRVFNPSATLRDLLALAEACSFEAAQARRNAA